ncbi:MAG: PH domain-containing protein [Sedimentisphaerales bacterium]|nr:PH domain-containing protein [Sedimentisphaerales bacterium]
MVKTQNQTASNPNIDELLPSDLLAEDEIVIFAIKPSLWTILFVSFRTVLYASLLALVTFIVGPAIHLAGLSSYIYRACGVVVFARLGFAVLQWASRSYVLTDRRVLRIRGVFTIDIFQSSLGRIQNTFLVLTLAQRILGLGNIEFTTAGTAQVEAVWRHVRHPLDVHRQLLRALNAATVTPAAPATGV